MDIKEYYADLQRVKHKLVGDLTASKYPGQPEAEVVADPDPDIDNTMARPTAVYITSVRNRMHTTTSGHVCLATIENASVRITDGTHRVSTEPEIRAYLQRQLDFKRTVDAHEMRERNTFQVTVPGN